MTNLQKISILCAAVLTMGLTACGETAENSDSKDNTAVTTTTTAAETTTTTTAAPADDSVAETTTTASSESADSEIADSEEKSEHSGIIKTKNEFCNGELYAKYSYDENGLLVRKDNYIKYKNAGFPLQVEESYGENQNYTTYDYDENGNCILECKYNNDTIVSKTEKVYNENNKIISETESLDDGKENKTTYYYDVQNQDYTNQIVVESRTVGNTTNTSTGIYKNEYTEWIKRTEGFKNGKTYGTYNVYAYDNHDNLLISSQWIKKSENSDIDVDIETGSVFLDNLYDENENLIEICALFDEYDDSDNKIGEHNKSATEVTFEYDKENRVIKSIKPDNTYYSGLILPNRIKNEIIYEFPSTTYYEYNDNNELTKETCRLLDSDKDDWKYELTYDYEYYD